MLGDIAIQWNYLEVIYHKLIHCYIIDLPVDVASAIFNAMGSGQKADFFEFLIAKYETEPILRDRMAHFQKMIHIVGENRNIVQHSLPSVEPRFAYEGAIYKRNRLGEPVRYEAPADALAQVLVDIEETKGYAHMLISLLHARLSWQMEKKRGARGVKPNYERWLEKFDKPDLPHRLIPTPLGSVPS
jgi:hypothetical protein